MVFSTAHYADRTGFCEMRKRKNVTMFQCFNVTVKIISFLIALRKTFQLLKSLYVYLFTSSILQTMRFSDGVKLGRIGNPAMSHALWMLFTSSIFASPFSLGRLGS